MDVISALDRELHAVLGELRWRQGVQLVKLLLDTYTLGVHMLAMDSGADLLTSHSPYRHFDRSTWIASMCWVTAFSQ